MVKREEGSLPLEDWMVWVALRDARLSPAGLRAIRSLLAEKESLNLDPHQVKQAETQRGAADDRREVEPFSRKHPPVLLVPRGSRGALCPGSIWRAN